MELQFSSLSPTHPSKVLLQKGDARLQSRLRGKAGAPLIPGFQSLRFGRGKRLRQSTEVPVLEPFTVLATHCSGHRFVSRGESVY